MLLNCSQIRTIELLGKALQKMNESTEEHSIRILPLLGSNDLCIDELDKPKPAQARKFSAGPILVSVFLHGLGLSMLAELWTDPPKQAENAQLAIQLQLIMPQQLRAPEQQEAQIIEVESAKPVDSITAGSADLPAQPPPLVALPQQPVVNVTTDTPPSLPEALTPTRLVLKQFVEQLRSQEENQSNLVVCTPLQERNPMLRCADQLDTPFDNIQLDNDNRFFAASVLSSSPSSDTRMRRISDSLRETGMVQTDIDLFMKGIDLNAMQRSTSGDARATAVKDQLFRNDSTYQQMKRAMNP